jgi:phage-related protein
VQIIGEASLRIGAITRDLRRTLQRSINDALSGLKAPKKNALTELQRELNRGELDLANATRKHTAAQVAAVDAEKELVALRKNDKATTEQLAAAGEKHHHSLLSLRVATDELNVAQGKHRSLLERLRRGNIDLERDNNRVSRSLGVLAKSFGGVFSGLAGVGGQASKLALIGVAAGGAVAGVTSLTVGVGALVAALGQAAGAAGLLPAVLAGKWAVVGTAKLALVGFDDALKAVASGDAAKLNEALKNMAPSAQAFVRQIDKIKPSFDAMRMDVQQRAFAGLASSLQPLADRYLPQANRLFVGIAGSMNQAARETIRMAMSGEALKNTQTTVGNLRASAANLAPAFAPAVQAIMNVVSVGSTFLPKLTASFASGIQGMSARITEMARNGELEAFFQRALDTIAQLGRIAGNVGGILSGVFNAAKGAGGGLLANLEQLTAKLSEFVNSARGQSALTGFFQAMRTITAALMPVLLQVATIIGTTLAPIIANLAATVLPALLPVLQAFGTLLSAAAPLIDVLAETLAGLLVAFAPVIEMFAQAITDVMPQLLPAFMALGEALVQLITAAAPLLPLFVQLFAALLPILPPIIQLATALLPVLVTIIQALMPVISALVTAFTAVMPVVTAVATVIANILLPPIRLIAAVITAVVNVAVGIFNFFAGAIRSGVQKIISFIGFLGSIPGKVAGFFQRMRDGAVQRAIALVNWVKGLPGRILSGLANLGSMLLQAGVNAIQGLLNGLKNAAGAVLDWIKGLAGDIIDGVLGIFGISSPSKVFHEIGMNVGRGLIRGIQAITPKVVGATNTMAAQVTSGARVSTGVDMAAITPAGLGVLDPAPPADGAGVASEDLADAVARGMEQVVVVISATEITSKVNRRNRSDARR